MATMRSYEDGCAAAHALDLVGERWALLVVRELLLGPKRFTDLRAGLPNVSPNVLAQRLHDLEQAGVVRRRKSFPRRLLPRSMSSPNGAWSSNRSCPYGALGRPLPFEASRRCAGRRFPCPLLPDDVRPTRCPR